MSRLRVLWQRLRHTIFINRSITLASRIEREITRELGKRGHSALILLNSLFKNPAITRTEAQEICSLSKKAANELVNIFSERYYLREITGKSRNQIFLFDPYIKLFE